MVVAADAALAAEIVHPDRAQALEDYLVEVRKASDIDRLATDRPKTGVDLGITATNPVSGEQVPVWASDYVLADYGTGAIMAVPAHDQRDLDFAKAVGLPVRRVIDTGDDNPEETFVATSGDGAYVNSGELDGLHDKASGIRTIIERLEADGRGSGAVNFRLRDWLLSRQRYWGAPIPIIHCPRGRRGPRPRGPAARHAADAQGRRPEAQGHLAAGRGERLGQRRVPDVRRPGHAGTRDTMDTFVDSSWYMFRYCSPHEDDRPFDPDKVNAWMPANLYVGGVEHAVLHLLYGRFFTKVLNDMGLVGFREPWSAQLNQGFVINQGKKMSKSLGNGVNLGEQLTAFGVDAVRLTLVFAGPPEDDIDWADMSPDGSLRFLQRAWRLSGDVASEPGRRRHDR